MLCGTCHSTCGTICAHPPPFCIRVAGIICWAAFGAGCLPFAVLNLRIAVAALDIITMLAYPIQRSFASNLPVASLEGSPDGFLWANGVILRNRCTLRKNRLFLWSSLRKLCTWMGGRRRSGRTALQFSCFLFFCLFCTGRKVLVDFEHHLAGPAAGDFCFAPVWKEVEHHRAGDFVKV